MSKSPFTAAELREFKELLEYRKRLLRGEVSRLEGEALKEGSGDLSTMPLHMADLGTDTFEQDMNLGLMQNENDELQAIEDALERIKEGVYGLCELCRKPMPKLRLRAIPYASLCIPCKRKEEGV